MESSQIKTLEHVNRLSSTARIMNNLLDREPLWKTNSQLPLTADKPNTHSTPESAMNCANGSDACPNWPNPQLKHGLTQEKIAMRALTTLQWLHGIVQHRIQQFNISFKNACTQHRLGSALEQTAPGSSP